MRLAGIMIYKMHSLLNGGSYYTRELDPRHVCCMFSGIINEVRSDISIMFLVDIATIL